MRWLLLALGLWVMGLPTEGQGIVWEKRVGWADTDELTDVISTPDGSFIACGESLYHGASFLTTRYPAVCLLSIFPNGDTAWFKPLPFYGVAPRLCPGDSEGFFLVATSGFIPPATSARYLALLKISYKGNVLWQREIPNTGGGTLARRMTRASNGDLLVVGRQGAQAPGDLYDMFVIRLDTSGIVYFKERYSENLRTYGNWIEETPSGTYLASGAAGSRIWAIEIDSNGAEVRRQTMYQTPTRAVFDETACVKQAPGGRYIASGSPLSFSPGFYYFGSFSSLSSASQIWGGERPSFTLPPHINEDGSIVLYHGTDNFYFSKFKLDSSLIWRAPFSSRLGSTSIILSALSYNSDSSVVAVGRSYTRGSSLTNDFYICRIRGVGMPYAPANPVSSKQRHKGLPALIAYPTPTFGPLTVHTRSRLPLVLYSLSGKKLLEARADPSGTTALDLSALPKGIYVLRQEESAVRVVKN